MIRKKKMRSSNEAKNKAMLNAVSMAISIQTFCK
jgi:hypothetical protein